MDASETQASFWSEHEAGASSVPAAMARRPARPATRRGADLAGLLSDPGRVLFLDVETTGLSRHYDHLTLVGYEVGGGYAVHMPGDDLTPLREALASARTLVTFNGTLFDIPFLAMTFEGLALPPNHVDLRYACLRLGWRGGQKAIERLVGFEGRDGLEGTDGAAAVLLWHRYLRGDVDALRHLIAYNRADVRGMAAILDRVVAESEAGRDLLADVPVFADLPRRETGTARPNAALPPPERFRRRAVTFRDLFGAHPAGRAVVVGIDLTGSEARPSGLCVLEGPRALTWMVSTDDEIVARTLNAGPALVSIDSPLSLPQGRTRVSDDDPGRDRYGIMRASERTLKRRGINVYPCLLPSMQRLTARGIALAARLRSLGIPVIESYPGAAQDILGIPRKGAGERWLKQGLAEFGLAGPFVTEDVRHDELDAITSALVGTFFLSGRFEALGGPGENALIVPDLDAPDGPLVVGISGRIAAGKTTAARALEARGFAYTRFSSVIDEEIRRRGLEPDRVARQAVGLEIHETRGQRWLCERVVERVRDATRIVVDGLRWPEDAVYLKERFGGRFLHLHVTAAVATRAARYAVKEPGEPDFRTADAQPVEGGIEALARMAVACVSNEGAVEALISRVMEAVDIAERGERPCPSRSS